MKKVWIMPQASVESFSTNEYLSTCWEVACKYTRANSWEKKNNKRQYNNGVQHGADGCGDKAHQVVQDINGDNIPDRMIELKTDLPDMLCTVFTDADYNRQMKISNVNPGDYIYWTTSASDGRIWHHQGEVQTINPSNPNRS